MDSRSIAVTGGAGFIGAPVVRLLVDRGAHVVIFDDLSRGSACDVAGAALLRGDIRDPRDVERLFVEHAPGAVIHLAALHFIPYCNEHPSETLDVNVTGTQVILDACERHNVSRLVYASSAAVYDPRGIGEAHCEHETPAPRDIYGRSKWFGEELVTAFAHRTGTASVIARLFNAYGPGETNPHVIPEILAQMAYGDVLALGNVTPRRDYVHVEDIARALALFAAIDATPLATFNVGNGQSLSVADIVALMARITSRPLRIEQAPGRVRSVDRPELLADISKAAQYGWRPQVGIEDGLAELLQANARATGAPALSRGA